MLLGSGWMLPGARFLGVLLGVVCVVCPELAATDQSTATTIDIGKDGVGVVPAEFDVSQGRWTVVRDATAEAGLALEQSGVPTAYDRFPLAIYKTASIRNAEISLRLKAVRLRSPRDYYLVQVDALRDRVLFFRVSGGASEDVAGVDANVISRGWQTLTVRTVDDQFAARSTEHRFLLSSTKPFPSPAASHSEPKEIASRDSTTSRSALY